MKILVINAGSSSLKYQLIDMDTNEVIAKGICERIGIEGSSITHKRPGKEKYFAEVAIANHDEAIALVMKTLTDAELGVIASVDEIGEENAAVVGEIFKAIPKIAKLLGLENGYRVISNVGEDGCQSVKHLHFHVVGGKKLSETMA